MCVLLCLISPEVNLYAQLHRSGTDCYFILNANSFRCWAQGFPCGGTKENTLHLPVPISGMPDTLTHTQTDTCGRARRPVGAERSRRWLGLPLTSLFRLYTQTDRQVSDQLNTNYPLLVQVAGRSMQTPALEAEPSGPLLNEQRRDVGRLARGHESACVTSRGLLLGSRSPTRLSFCLACPVSVCAFHRGL